MALFIDEHTEDIVRSLGTMFNSTHIVCMAFSCRKDTPFGILLSFLSSARSLIELTTFVGTDLYIKEHYLKLSFWKRGTANKVMHVML